MSRHNRSNRRGQTQRSRPRMLYLRATGVVVSDYGVVLVKHNRQKEWALPGGRVVAAEDPAHRIVLEIAEETGLIIENPVHMGRYAGTVASHEIFMAQANGVLRPNRRELQDAMWWDMRSSVDVQPHVSAILAIVRLKLKETEGTSIPSGSPPGSGGVIEGGVVESQLSEPVRLALMDGLEQVE